MKIQAQQIKKLIERASECDRYGDSNAAIHFSQAAVNCSNAMMNLAALSGQFPDVLDSTESSDSGDVA